MRHGTRRNRTMSLKFCLCHVRPREIFAPPPGPSEVSPIGRGERGSLQKFCSDTIPRWRDRLKFCSDTIPRRRDRLKFCSDTNPRWRDRLKFCSDTDPRRRDRLKFYSDTIPRRRDGLLSGDLFRASVILYMVWERLNNA